ncbi:MAG: hypothetical protein N2Z72_06860 [Bacteroidales bacterium]|nr:hypothetical protein [Bacteroidales bacterium]
MKKYFLRLGVAIITLSFIAAGCGLKKMQKKYHTVKYETKPQVLETHGGKINVSVKGAFPAKYFNKKATVEFTPVLKWNGGSHTCKSIILAGEKVKGGSGTIIKYKEGSTFEWTDVIPYKPEMNASELVVNAVAKKGKKTVALGEVKLADGVIYTSERVGKDEDVFLADHGYKKEVIISEKSVLYFDYNSSNLSMNQKLNKLAENQAIRKKAEDFIAKGWKIKSIDIQAWASPEGEESYNADLSKKRGDEAKKYIENYIKDLDTKIAKQQKKKYEEVKRPYVINTDAKGEDFDGFMKQIEKSNIKDKQAIINVIRSQPDKARREQEIKNMAIVYAEVEAILEPLRRAEISINCYEPKYTDEKIAQLALTNPDSLKPEELLYAATLTDDLNKKLTIYKTGTKIYADNWKFWNNAGYILLKQQNLKEATPFIEKANALSPNNPIVTANMGVIASWNKQYDQAKSLYEKAQSGVNVNYNLGILKIREGDYNAAMNLFGTTTCRYNIGLVQTLLGKYSEATNTFNCVKPQTAEVYYLLAVVGARTNNTTMLYDNLKKAIEKNPALKAEAKEDREFIKYFNTTDFQNIVK